MKKKRNLNCRHTIIAVACCLALLLPLGLAKSFGDSHGLSSVSRESLRLGERIYREGILPSGESLRVSGLAVPGTSYACASCHLRGGLGYLADGGVFIPPINGTNLFKPFRIYSSPRHIATPFVPRQLVLYNQGFTQKLSNRPMYTDESLSKALRDGIDSAGRKMNDSMPRYLLEDKDMKQLISYLKSLSSEFSPGVSDTTLRFATIITDDVNPEYRDAMLVPLENYFRNRNQANIHDPKMIRSMQVRSTGARSRLMAASTFTSLAAANRKLSLSRWLLKGAPDTWRSQLEEYNRKEPVFAILGGITNGEWQPIHKFCEDNQIPCIFPITNFPVISRTDWYTLYLTKGYYQEGEGAARFLNGKIELEKKPVVQIVRDTPEGRALARGFEETWHDLGQEATTTIILKAGETLTEENLRQKQARKKTTAILLWDGPESLKTLEILAAGKEKPTTVLVSSSFLGRSMMSMNEQARDFTYITYLYGLARTPEQKTTTTLKPVEVTKIFDAEANADARIRISQQSYALTVVLDAALAGMKGNYYRDDFLDVIGNLEVPLYERLSFGPGLRYASDGCYIVQLTKTGLVKKSGWATQ